MTIDEIKRGVQEVGKMAVHNPDLAASHEDRLYVEFAQHVAGSAEGTLKEMAAELLRSRQFDFKRR